MKVLILNGSPRQGNTKTAIRAYIDGLPAGTEVEVVDTYKLKVGPCRGCGACQYTNGCMVDKTDDTNPTIDKIVAADVLVFATPVYWWGITAQIKLVLDKCYCRAMLMRDKTTGLIMVGGSEPENVQYDLIRSQFNCISEYLGWNFLFQKAYYASEATDLAKNTAAIEELRSLGALLPKE